MSTLCLVCRSFSNSWEIRCVVIAVTHYFHVLRSNTSDYSKESLTCTFFWDGHHITTSFKLHYAGTIDAHIPACTAVHLWSTTVDFPSYESYPIQCSRDISYACLYFFHQLPFHFQILYDCCVWLFNFHVSIPFFCTFTFPGLQFDLLIACSFSSSLCQTRSG